LFCRFLSSTSWAWLTLRCTYMCTINTKQTNKGVFLVILDLLLVLLSSWMFLMISMLANMFERWSILMGIQLKVSSWSSSTLRESEFSKLSVAMNSRVSYVHLYYKCSETKWSNCNPCHLVWLKINFDFRNFVYHALA